MRKIEKTPRQTSEILHACPPPGEGVHRWIMQAAWACRKLGCSAQDAIRILRNRISRPPRPANEIEQAVARVFQCPSLPKATQFKHPTRWPKPNPEKISTVVSSGFGLVDLWEASPVRFHAPATEEIIRSLFRDDELVCFATDTRTAQTRFLRDWPDLRYQLCVPSPMSAVRGVAQSGRESSRCLNNTGERRFLVTEFDSRTVDEQAAIVAHLAQSAPLVLALFSGGKSLHAWWRAAGVSESILKSFFARACELGADPATWTRCQLVRTPDALRDNGQRQTVYFFNPPFLK